jgi:predicted PhzF superfamily epimerase YddE/YHI9
MRQGLRLENTAIINYFGKTCYDYFIELDDYQVLLELKPNFNALQEMDRGFIITAKAPPEITEYDFVSRVFDAPAGINEDSVTGNAHCASAPYWSKTLGNELIGYQASKRGGFVKCTYENDVTKLNGCCVLMVRMNDADILNLITEC